MRKDIRVYPRIQSEWRLFCLTPKGKRPIGYVRDISLTGASLRFSEDYRLDPERHHFHLMLRNEHLNPPELEISGLKEWEQRREREAFLGLVIERLDRRERSALVRFLSRSDRLQVEAVILDAGAC